MAGGRCGLVCRGSALCFCDAVRRRDADLSGVLCDRARLPRTQTDQGQPVKRPGFRGHDPALCWTADRLRAAALFGNLRFCGARGGRRRALFRLCDALSRAALLAARRAAVRHRDGLRNQGWRYPSTSRSRWAPPNWSSPPGCSRAGTARKAEDRERRLAAPPPPISPPVRASDNSPRNSHRWYGHIRQYIRDCLRAHNAARPAPAPWSG